MSSYHDFIANKSQQSGNAGFEPHWMPEFLFDFQKHLVQWAVRKGRAAIFADCGLGKTPMIARRTRMKSLRHKNICEDSATVRIGPADYVLVFKKGWENPEPIEHPEGLKSYAGEEEIPEDLVRRFKNYKGDQRKNLLSHWIWRRYASPVWMDIRSGRLLPYQDSKENEEEKHVCPLQLDVIERLLTLYSNPGDTVLTPFMGVGSEVFQAVCMGRKGIGIELKESYYRQALKNVEAANSQNAKLSESGLFDDSEDELDCSLAEAV